MKYNSRFTLAEKIAWAQLYLSGERSLRDVATEAGVPHQTLACWVKKAQLKRFGTRYMDMSKTPTTSAPAPDPRDAEILRLKAELEQAKLQAHAFDTMISIAEKELNIQIRKKAGAKQ